MKSSAITANYYATYLAALVWVGMGSLARADTTISFSDDLGAQIPSGSIIRSDHYQQPGTADFGGLYATTTGGISAFSTTIQADPGLIPGTPNAATPISVFVPTVALNDPIATLDTSSPSGVYEATITLRNDQDASDPGDVLTAQIRLYEPPVFSGPMIIDVNAGEPVVLSIDAPAPDGLVAGGRRFGASFSNGFSVESLGLFDEIQPGQTVSSPVRYNPNRHGRLTSVQTGRIQLSFEPITETGETILPKKQNGLPSLLESYEYELRYTYADTLFDTASISAGEPIVWNDIGVNTASVAAVINRGRPSADVTVQMQVVDNPLAPGTQDDPRLISDVVSVAFSEPADLYGIELRYDPATLPDDVGNAELALLGFDAHTQSWVPAVTLNSDDGVGAREGTFSLGRTIGSRDLMTEDLGLNGSSNNTLWAVLDTGGLFAVGLLPVTLPGDLSGDGDVDDEDLGLFFIAFTGPELSQGPLTNPAADLSGDGDVDDEDLGLAFAGFTGPLAPTSVPEPASLTLLMLLGGLIVRRRR